MICKIVIETLLVLEMVTLDPFLRLTFDKLFFYIKKLSYKTQDLVKRRNLCVTKKICVSILKNNRVKWSFYETTKILLSFFRFKFKKRK